MVEEIIQLLKMNEEETDSEYTKEQNLNLIKIMRILVETSNKPVKLNQKFDVNLLLSNLRSFFEKMLKNYDKKEEGVLSFVNKEEGFFFANLIQATLISSEITFSRFDPKDVLFPFFSFLNLYLLNFEAMCCFLKPFIENFLGQQISDDTEKMHNEVYKYFKKWLNPEAKEIFETVIDLKIRNCIAHASYTINIADKSVTFRDSQSGKIKTLEFKEFMTMLEELIEICKYVVNVFLEYLCDLFETLLEKDQPNLDLTIFHKALNLDYVIRNLEKTNEFVKMIFSQVNQK